MYWKKNIAIFLSMNLCSFTFVEKLKHDFKVKGKGLYLIYLNGGK